MNSLAQTQIPGGWTEREVPIASHTFRLLLPADPDAFLSQLIAGDPPTATDPHLVDPYWSQLWPAAVHLAKFILSDHQPSAADFPPAGTRVLELGCGSGLAGLAGLARGWEVAFSDYVPLTVDLALENARRNGCSQARGLVLDWRQPLAERFPLIVAADVTYDRANIGPLLGVLEAMLAPGGQAWLADAGRGPVAEFMAQAASRNWQLALFDEAGRPAANPALGHCQLLVLQRR